MGIGSSTARMILRRYEDSGTVFEPKNERKKSALQELKEEVHNKSQEQTENKNSFKDLNDAHSSLLYFVVYQHQINPYYCSYI